MFTVLIFTAGAGSAGAAGVDARALAKHHFEDAEREYRLGRFENAVEAYSRAYEHVPEPELLFNIAQCHRNLGHLERAVFFYRGYLREAKNPSNRPRVERLIAELETKMKAQQAGEEDVLAKNSSTLPGVRPPERAIVAPASSLAVEDDDSMPVWPWIVGAAVVAVAGGTALALTMSRDNVPDDVDRGLLLDFRDR